MLFFWNDKDNIYGIDLNKDEIEKLKKQWYTVKCEWVTETSFEDEEFDVIVSDNVIEHLFPQEA